jgi:hypothetical protein
MPGFGRGNDGSGTDGERPGTRGVPVLAALTATTHRRDGPSSAYVDVGKARVAAPVASVTCGHRLVTTLAWV